MIKIIYMYFYNNKKSYIMQIRGGKNMKILVVNPPNKPFTNKSIIAEPIDILQIATVIQKEYKEVKVLDMDLNQMNNNINKYLEEKNILIFVFDYHIPLHTTETKDNIFEIIKNIPKEIKTTTIVIGKTSSYYYEEFLKNGIDILITGIVEQEINKVIKYIDKKEELLKIPNLVFKWDDKIYKTEKKRVNSDFKDLPIPNRELVDIKKYMDTRTMITSRGCIGNCAFCATPYFFGKWTAKTPKQVVDEIELLTKKYHAKKIMFLDDNATVSKKRMIEICEEIKRRNLKCLFGALASLKTYDEEMFQTMYEVGFRWVHFGIESGSSRILNSMNKFFDVDITKKIITKVKELGYRVRVSLILDYPTSTKEDIEKTKNLILETMPHEIRLHYLTYRVGTPIFLQKKTKEITSQYIHRKTKEIKDKDLMSAINNLVEELKNKDYEIITDDIDWNKYNDMPKDTKIAAFTPIKYGVCWYE